MMGSRLWINDKLLISKWQTQPSTEWAADVELAAGKTHTIKVEYREGQGQALARLRWSSPKFTKAVISRPYLFSGQVITDNEPAVHTSLSVFPQPAHDWLTVRYSASKPGPVQVEVTDLLGRRMYGRSARSVMGQNEYAISVADWPAGLYQLLVTPADQSAVFRRILVR